MKDNKLNPEYNLSFTEAMSELLLGKTVMCTRRSAKITLSGDNVVRITKPGTTITFNFKRQDIEDRWKVVNETT